MKYKKNKLRLNEIASAIQGFYFLVKFGLVLIHRLKVYRKKSSSILFDFLLNSMYLLKFFIDFSVENLETPPSNFLSKCFSEIYLSPILLIIEVVTLNYT